VRELKDYRVGILSNKEETRHWQGFLVCYYKNSP